MSRLRLSRSDFENHILRPKRPITEVTTSLGGGVEEEARDRDGVVVGGGKGTDFISANNKVRTEYMLHYSVSAVRSCFIALYCLDLMHWLYTACHHRWRHGHRWPWLQGTKIRESL